MESRKFSKEKRGESLEQSLLSQLEYYRNLSVQSGRKRVREIDLLTRLNNELKQTKDRLQYRVELDKLAAEIGRLFLGINRDENTTVFAAALNLLGIFYSSRHSFILSLGETVEESEITYFWSEPGFLSSFLPVFSLTETCKVMIHECFMHHNDLSLQDLKWISKKIYSCLAPEFDSANSIMFPLFSDGLVSGFLGFEELPIDLWTDDDVMLIRMLSDIFTNALECERLNCKREKLEEQLQIRQRIDSLGSLAGGIAHDLNNILVSIIGNIDLVQRNESGLSAKCRINLEKAFLSSKRAANLIKELQAFSKGTVSEKRIVDIHDIMKNVFDLLDRTSRAYIEKRLLIEPKSRCVIGSEDMLHQALFNLGTNAVHAIDERGNRDDDCICVSAESVRLDENDPLGLPQGPYVHICFEDNGCGMSEDVRAKAFDPMFTTRRSSYKGQGLGLAMVYNTITQNHGGAVTIDSKEGVGTTFHIYLPEADNPVSEKTEKQKTSPSEGSETVLVVDDDDSVISLLVEALGMYGYKALTAEDGEEGLAVFTEHQGEIDLVLLDYIMPKMSGAELCKKIRELKPKTKVILSSGHSEQDIQNVMDVNSYLVKPYEIMTLIKTVRETLDSP